MRSTRRSVGRRSLELLLVVLAGIGVPSALAAGGIIDCNGNGVDDATDIANETSDDCNSNGIPDECETNNRIVAADSGLYVEVDGDSGAASIVAGDPPAFGNYAAMAYDPNTDVYYLLEGSTTVLYTLVPATGEMAVVGPTGVGDDGSGNNLAGIAFDSTNNVLYGIRRLGEFYSIDTTTGAATFIGATGAQFTESLAYDSTADRIVTMGAPVVPPGPTCASNILEERLWEIDRITGVGTILGCSGIFNKRAQSLSFDGAAGRLYATIDFSFSSDELVAVSPADGSLISNIGQTEFADILATAFNPNTGALWAVRNPQSLQIDTTTGAGTFAQILGRQGTVGLAYDATRNRMYGADTYLSNFGTSETRIQVIDLATGVPTTLGNSGIDALGVADLAYDPFNDLIYAWAETFGGFKLFSFDPVTGVGTEVGPMTEIVVGLTVDPGTGTLYGTTLPGAFPLDPGNLVTIDKTTAAVTTIGNVGFGGLFGLAFDSASGQIIGISESSGALITINPGTGSGSFVGQLFEITRGLAIDSTTGQLYGGPGLVRIDQGTALAQTVGRSTLPSALAYHTVNEKLYGADFSNSFFEMDPDTGESTVLANSLPWDVFGLAYDPDTNRLLGLLTNDTLTYFLAEISTSTGTQNVLGGVGAPGLSSLAFDTSSNLLYSVDVLTGDLYSIDRFVGTATLVGSTGTDRIEGLTHDPSTGMLIGTNNSDEQTWSIDPITAVATPLGDTLLHGIRGLAYITDAGDCDGNGTLDECDPDCDNDGTPDACAILECSPGDPTCADCDGNMIPDGCQADSDLDGVIDACDQCPGEDDSPDCDDDGTPDCVVVAMCDGSPACDDCDSNGVPDGCEVNLQTEYAIDDGGPQGSLGLDAPADFAWLNQLTVAPDGETVTRIRVMFNQMPIGTPVRLVLWSDPNDDGNPIDAQVIAVFNEEITRNDTFYADYDIAPTSVGSPGEIFYVGAVVTVNNQFPARRDTNNPAGQSWAAGHNPGALDLNNLSGGGLLVNLTDLDPSLNGNFMVRAVATANPDCNENGRQDACDIDSGDSLDENMDGIPDECVPDCPAPPAPTAEASGIPRNRYLSMNLGNPVGQYAIRVTLPASDPNSGGVDITQYAGPPTAPREAQDPGDTFDASLLQCTPHFQDWSAFDLVSLYGPNVVPGSTYEVELVPDCCVDPSDRACGSATLVVATAEQWADVVAPFADSGFDQPDINDVLAIIDKLLGQKPPLKVETQLQPAALNPDDTIKIADVLDCVDSLLGAGYPYAAPTPCP